MAESGGTGESQGESQGDIPKEAFPKEISLDDDKPSSGFFTLELTIPNMQTKSSGLVTKEYSVTNGSHKIQITEGDVSVAVSVEKDGKTKQYSYTKKLPVKVNKEKCKYKLKDETVILIFCKVEKASLGQYEKHFKSRP